MALSVETLFPSPKETMCDKHLWEARDFSRVRLHGRAVFCEVVHDVPHARRGSEVVDFHRHYYSRGKNAS